MKKKKFISNLSKLSKNCTNSAIIGGLAGCVAGFFLANAGIKGIESLNLPEGIEYGLNFLSMTASMLGGTFAGIATGVSYTTLYEFCRYLKEIPKIYKQRRERGLDSTESLIDFGQYLDMPTQ